MLPNEIRLADAAYPVNQIPLRNGLGRFDRSTGAIDIHADQPEAGKHIILLHELLHFTAEILIQNGVLKKAPPEAFIENAAPILLKLLVDSGMYSGLDRETLEAFMLANMTT